MTNQQIIDQVVANPAVIAAHTQPGPGGAPQLPSATALNASAATSLQFVLGELLMDQSIRRRILERSTSITPTSATHTLDTFVSRVLGVLTGSDSRPLKIFDNKADHDLWYYQTYDPGSSSSTDIPVAVYESGRAANGAIKITFSPGIGTETSFTIRYVRNVGPTLNVSLFPDEVHPVVLLGVINTMTGGQFDQQYERLRLDMIRSLEVFAGGHSRMRHDDRVRRIIRRLNSMGYGYGGAWDAWASQKWVD